MDPHLCPLAWRTRRTPRQDSSGLLPLDHNLHFKGPLDPHGTPRKSVSSTMADPTLGAFHSSMPGLWSLIPQRAVLLHWACAGECGLPFVPSQRAVILLNTANSWRLSQPHLHALSDRICTPAAWRGKLICLWALLPLQKHQFRAAGPMIDALLCASLCPLGILTPQQWGHQSESLRLGYLSRF